MSHAAPSAVAPLGRQVARNTIASYLGRAVYVLGWMALTPWMLDRLGPDRFGLWSLVTIVSGLYITFDLGMQSALTRYIAEFRAVQDTVRIRAVIGMACTLYAALSVIWVVLLVLGRGWLLELFRVTPALREEAGWALICAGVGYASINASMFVGALYSGIHRMDRWALLSVASTLVQLVAVAVSLAMDGGVVGVVLANGVVLMLSTTVAIVLLRRMAPDLRPTFHSWPTGLWSRLLRYSAALQIINIGLLVLFQFEKFAFGRWLGLREVGEWELAYRLTFSVWALPALLLPPLLSAVAHLGAAGEWERLARITERASRLLLLVAFPISAGLVSLGPTFVQAWLGDGHALVSRATAALGLALGVNILTGVGSTVLRGLDRAGVEAQYHLIGILLHVTIAIWLVPRIGFDGGLVAVVVSMLVSSLWFVVRYHREMRTSAAGFLRVTVGPIAFAATAGGAAAWFVANLFDGPDAGASRGAAAAAFAIGGVTLLATYAVTLVSMRFVSREQWAELVGLLRARSGQGDSA